jgi:hypothetical protein
MFTEVGIGNMQSCGGAAHHRQNPSEWQSRVLPFSTAPSF